VKMKAAKNRLLQAFQGDCETETETERGKRSLLDSVDGSFHPRDSNAEHQSSSSVGTERRVSDDTVRREVELLLKSMATTRDETKKSRPKSLRNITSGDNQDALFRRQRSNVTLQINPEWNNKRSLNTKAGEDKVFAKQLSFQRSSPLDGQRRDDKTFAKQSSFKRTSLGGRAGLLSSMSMRHINAKRDIGMGMKRGSSCKDFGRFEPSSTVSNSRWKIPSINDILGESQKDTSTDLQSSSAAGTENSKAQSSLPCCEIQLDSRREKIDKTTLKPHLHEYH